MSLRPVRGTQDLLPEIQIRHNYIVDQARDLAQKFGMGEISTPIFEYSEVFKRTLGAESDIVNKEMYTFADRSGDELTLRPEGTAPVVRAFITEGLQTRTPLKLFYYGPMFRYERPQKGRYRQFHQLGIEILGAPSPFADVECIAFGAALLDKLGIAEKCVLEINSIGDAESRATYRAALTQYLEARIDQLSEESRRRLKTNPLRILDSKDKGDQQVLSDAPKIEDSLTPAARDFFAQVTCALDALGIRYVKNPFLVRGLDYYSHVVFEFRTTHLGAQDAVLSGGRYDQLVKQMGGPDTAGVGFAAGIERLSLLGEWKVLSPAPVVVVPVHASVETAAFKMAFDLRRAGFVTEIAYSGNLSKRMKRAAGQNAWAAILLGPDEITRGQVQVKLMDRGEQVLVELSELAEKLKALRPPNFKI